MEAMFRGAFAFNADLSEWDVGQVTSMSSMFDGARSFNQDLSDWEVGRGYNYAGDVCKCCCL